MAIIASLSARRAWIEIASDMRSFGGADSLSARRAWIEIIKFVNLRVVDGFALRKESVDRNCDLEPIKNPEAVALRKESVDRNLVASVVWVSVVSLSARSCLLYTSDAADD